MASERALPRPVISALKPAFAGRWAQTFLEALRSSGVRRLTYISTYEVFEVVDNEIDETHPIADEDAVRAVEESSRGRVLGLHRRRIAPAQFYR